jgi:putative membrane protein
MPALDWLPNFSNFLVAAASEGASNGASMDWSSFFKNVVSSIVFTGIGLVFFAAAFWVICKFAPFSVQKEIEDDQNTSLAILIGSVIIGIAIIIAAAVRG